MNIVVKKTTELSESEQHGINDLFNRVFLRERPIEQFRSMFFNTVLGYSYHAVLYDGDAIAGCVSRVPVYYNVDGQKHLAAYGSGFMLDEKYRGIRGVGYLREAIPLIDNHVKDSGVTFLYGFPNENSYPVSQKLKTRRDIGKLTTYALPYRIGGIKPSLKNFNCLSILFSKFYVFLTSLFAGGKVYRFPIEKDAETYNKVRYNMPNGGYHIEEFKGGGFVYKIMDYEGTRAAFLIDVFAKSAKNFNIAVRHIIKNHGKEFDILLYIGHLPFGCHGLIKIPKRFAPKNFHFTGKLLREDVIDADLFFNINSWDVNLSNYDLL